MFPVLKAGQSSLGLSKLIVGNLSRFCFPFISATRLQLGVCELARSKIREVLCTKFGFLGGFEFSFEQKPISTALTPKFCLEIASA